LREPSPSTYDRPIWRILHFGLQAFQSLESGCPMAPRGSRRCRIDRSIRSNGSAQDALAGPRADNPDGRWWTQRYGTRRMKPALVAMTEIARIGMAGLGNQLLGGGLGTVRVRVSMNVRRFDRAFRKTRISLSRFFFRGGAQMPSPVNRMYAEAKPRTTRSSPMRNVPTGGRGRTVVSLVCVMCPRDGDGDVEVEVDVDFCSQQAPAIKLQSYKATRPERP